MDIQLIAMDLDGTALQPDQRSFSPRLIAALEEAHKRGIAIAPITGRQFNMLPPAVQNHPEWENLTVLCNGAQIRRMATGEVLYAKNISRQALEQLLEQFEVSRETAQADMETFLQYLNENGLIEQ